jgi:hypothetical protein
MLNAIVLREWRYGHLTIGKVRGVGWQLHSRFEQRELVKWGVIVECEGEFLDDGHISETKMRGVIERELAPFENIIAILPPWI